MKSIHGRLDFCSMYHFTEITRENKDIDIIDAYEALDRTLPDMFAYPQYWMEAKVWKIQTIVIKKNTINRETIQLAYASFTQSKEKIISKLI